MNIYDNNRYIEYPFVEYTDIVATDRGCNPNEIILDLRVTGVFDSYTGDAWVTALTTNQDGAVTIDIMVGTEACLFELQGPIPTNGGYTVLRNYTGTRACTLVLGPSAYTVASPLVIPDGGYRLLPACIIPTAGMGVSSIALQGGGTFTGDVILRPGINATISSSGSRVVIGHSRRDGVYTCEDIGASTPKDELYYINGVAADDNNNIVFAGGNSVSVVVSTDPHTLDIYCTVNDECC